MIIKGILQEHMKKINILSLVFLSLLFFPLSSFASLDANLYYGLSNNNNVSQLQNFLISKGFLASSATGNFYSLTLNAVKKYQASQNISQTGYVGILTRSAINNDLAGQLQQNNAPATALPAITPLAISTNNLIPSLQAQIALLQEQLNVLRNQQEAMPIVFSAQLPSRLKIPNISVDAPIIYVGLTSDGAMDTPKGPSEVAWYKLGPRPGENGNAVISGHYGRWVSGEGSVFDNLNKLIAGDKIYIEDEKGATITFVVRESRRFDPAADATEVFISSDGKAHLNIVTCEGTWDPINKTFSNRLIIFADKQ